MEITSEMKAKFVEEYKRIDGYYTDYLRRMDKCQEGGDWSGAEMWEEGATQYKYELQGMRKSLLAFGLYIVGDEIKSFNDN